MSSTTPARRAVDAGAIATAMAEAEAGLRAALLAGRDTAPHHAELAALRAERDRLAAVEARAAAEAEAGRDRAFRQRITAAAARHVDEAARRLRDRLGRLHSPSVPAVPARRTT